LIIGKRAQLAICMGGAVSSCAGMVCAFAGVPIFTAAAGIIGIAAAVTAGYAYTCIWNKVEKVSVKLGVPCGAGGALASIENVIEREKVQVDKLRSEVDQLNIQIMLSQRQRRNTEEIIYSIRDAVIVIDEGEQILLANDTLGELFDFDPQAGKGKTVGQVIKCPEFTNILRQSKDSKTRHSKHDITISKPDGARIFSCIISCIYDEKHNICGVVSVLHDVTREKEISQMKNEFVSHVSHELKTPLASITAYAEMLADGEASDEATRTEFYSIIQSQAQRLNRLIEDILNISRIESGLVKISKEPVSITLVIRDSAEMIKSYAAEKNITVHAQTPIVFDQVMADKDMISQVVINLLSNAVKYTPAGGQVSISSEVNEMDNIVRVLVTDTGVGIPVDEVERVFDKFYRVKANNKVAKGTGLGLNLVKQIVEKVHDGRVFVSSKQGQGSTFGFELPLGVRQSS